MARILATGLALFARASELLTTLATLFRGPATGFFCLSRAFACFLARARPRERAIRKAAASGASEGDRAGACPGRPGLPFSPGGSARPAILSRVRSCCPGSARDMAIFFCATYLVSLRVPCRRAACSSSRSSCPWYQAAGPCSQQADPRCVPRPAGLAAAACLAAGLAWPAGTFLSEVGGFATIPYVVFPSRRYSGASVSVAKRRISEK